jgi:predicted transcriptional regulator
MSMQFLFCSLSFMHSWEVIGFLTNGAKLICYRNDYSILDVIEVDCFELELEMTDEGRVVTAKLPDELVSQMDAIAARIDRSKSWIVREAVSEWLAEEQRRYDLTLEAIKSMDEGRSFSQEDIEAHYAARRADRERAASAA